MLPVIFTAAPDNFVGEKRARFAASTAASRSKEGPDTACAEITLPLSSTTTSTSTFPDIRERLKYLMLGELVYNEGEQELVKEIQQHAHSHSG